MAKRSFQHSCGHSGVAHGHNRRAADSMADWLEKRQPLCGDCRAAEIRKANETAAAAAADAGLPAIQGSEAAALWAESLRWEALPVADALVALVTAALEAGTTTVTVRQEDLPPALAGWTARAVGAEVALLAQELGTPHRAALFLAALRSRLWASWWIDHRESAWTSRAASLRDEIARLEAAGRAAAEDACPVARAAKSEALLLPAGTPVCAVPAEVRIVGARVEAQLPVRHDAFADTVRALGFTWSKPRWVRTLGVPVGTLIDRAAETAHRLVAAGFVVRLFDDEARRRAGTGDFVAAPRRTVESVDGALRLSWRRPDDLFDVARSLPGARWRDGALRVPVGAIEAVVEFAERHDFLPTPDVMAALDAHRAALAGGAVVTTIREAPAPVTASRALTPASLPVPADVRADPALVEE